MESKWRNALFTVPSSLASLVLLSSPSAATSPSHAQLYGQITAGGTLESGSVGISSVYRPQTGYYCILPTTASGLQTAVAAGTVGVTLTPATSNWPYYPQIVAQVSNYGGHVQNACHSNSWIGVSVEYTSEAPEPTSTPTGTLPPVNSNAYNAAFTIMFD